MAQAQTQMVGWHHGVDTMCGFIGKDLFDLLLCP